MEESIISPTPTILEDPLSPTLDPQENIQQPPPQQKHHEFQHNNSTIMMQMNYSSNMNKMRYLQNQSSMLVMLVEDGGNKSEFKQMKRGELLTLARQDIDELRSSKKFYHDKKYQSRMYQGATQLRDIRLIDPAFKSNDHFIIVRKHAILVKLDPIAAIILRNRLILVVPPGADSLLQKITDKLKQLSEPAKIDSLAENSMFSSGDHNSLFDTKEEEEEEVIDSKQEKEQQEDFIEANDDSDDTITSEAEGKKIIKKKASAIIKGDNEENDELEQIVQETLNENEIIVLDEEKIISSRKPKSKRQHDKYRLDPKHKKDDAAVKHHHHHIKKRKSSSPIRTSVKKEINKMETFLTVKNDTINTVGFTIMIPFELNALESVLANVVELVRLEVNALKPTVKQTVKQVLNNSSGATLERLRQTRNQIAKTQSHISGMVEAFEELLEDDRDLALMRLTKLFTYPERYTKENEAEWISDHDDVELLLENYLQLIETSLDEVDLLKKEIESTQAAIMMRLDAARNSLLRVNLMVSSITSAAAGAALIAGIFGMNLDSGITGEEFYPTFWIVAAFLIFGTIIIVFIMFSCLYYSGILIT